MPYKDLIDAEKYWGNIKENVAANHIEPEYFYKMADRKKFHVRPKAKNSKDLTEAPNGQMVKKYCYWFNIDYIASVVADNK